MRIYLSVIVTLEILATLYYAWQLTILTGWENWKNSDPAAVEDIFNNSPDAAGIYYDLIQGTIYGQLFLAGIWFGSLGVVYLLLKSSDAVPAKGQKLLAKFVFLIPVIGYGLAHVVAYYCS